MGKKCIPGVFCIENMTLFILFFFMIVILYLYFTLLKRTNSSIKHKKPETNNITIVNNPGLGVSTAINDVLTNPYYPPLKNDGYFFPSNFGDIRGLPGPVMINTPVAPNFAVPVNVETRGLNTSYEQVGILTKTSNNGNNDLILPLMGRRNMAGRDKWQYYTISNTGSVNTKLPIKINGKSCTSEYGCDPLNSGDTVFVDGYNHSFKSTIYENNMFSYIPF
jgi:hypothetical protein